MAKLTVGKGITAYIKNLENLHKLDSDDYGRAIYIGAGIVADAVSARLNSIPYSVLRYDQKQGLIDSFGIATMRDDKGFYNVKLGFDGYNKHVTDDWPLGQPNAMIARVCEIGNEWIPKYPIMAPAVRASKAAAEQAMAQEVDRLIEVVMEE